MDPNYLNAVGKRLAEKTHLGNHAEGLDRSKPSAGGKKKTNEKNPSVTKERVQAGAEKRKRTHLG